MEQGAQSLTTVAPRSTRQAVVAPPSNVKSYVGVVSDDSAAGPLVIVGAAGAARSSVYERVASGPVLPAASVARTRNV